MTCTEAILLYDFGATAFAAGPVPNWMQIRITVRLDFDKFWPQANIFYKNALFTLELREFKIAGFLLHQASEQAYQAIVSVFTGYKPCTHNLDKLRRYTVRLSIELASLFPRNTPEEDHLFRLLLESYIGARYKTEYSITPTQVQELSERVRKLLSIAERICENQFIILNKLEAGCFAPADCKLQRVK